MSEPDYNPFAAPQSENLVVTPEGYIDFDALRTTGNGLRLIYFSLLLLVLLVLGTVGVSLFAGRAAGADQSGVAFLLVAGIGTLTATLVCLIGGIMCTTVPQESGGKWFAIASVAIQAINILVMFAGGYVGSAIVNMVANQVSVVANMVNAISLILFLLFLRRLSSFIHREDLRRRSSRVLIVLFVYVIAVILTAMSSIAAAFTAMIGGVGGLILFLMVANLVNDSSKAIRHPKSSPEDSRGYL